jgi:hypothetical protein
MARGVKKGHLDSSATSFLDRTPTPEELAAQQGVSPVANFDALLGDFWPEDESIDDFLETLYRWRRGDYS